MYTSVKKWMVLELFYFQKWDLVSNDKLLGHKEALL